MKTSKALKRSHTTRRCQVPLRKSDLSQPRPPKRTKGPRTAESRPGRCSVRKKKSKTQGSMPSGHRRHPARGQADGTQTWGPQSVRYDSAPRPNAQRGGPGGCGSRSLTGHICTDCGDGFQSQARLSWRRGEARGCWGSVGPKSEHSATGVLLGL